MKRIYRIHVTQNGLNHSLVNLGIFEDNSTELHKEMSSVANWLPGCVLFSFPKTIKIKENI